MWKRFPLYQRNRDPVIGHPILEHTTLDEKALNSYPNVSNVPADRASQAVAQEAPRRKSEDMLSEYKGLPTLPFEETTKPTSRPSVRRPGRPVSEIPTTSSMYSQPTPEIQQRPTTGSTQVSDYSPYSAEVSPISSPDLQPHDRIDEWHGSPNISPVEELPETPSFPQLPAQRYASHIPVARKSLPKGSSVQQGNLNLGGLLGKPSIDYRENRSSTATRWGDFTGPATETGRPTFYSHANSRISQGPTSAPQNKSMEGRTGSFAQRASKTVMKGLGINTSVASSNWQGGSQKFGKTSTGLDKPLPATTHVPAPVGGARQSSPEGANSGVTTPRAVLDRTVDETTFRARDNAADFVDDDHHHDEEDIKPIVPLKAGRNSPPRRISPPASATSHSFNDSSSSSTQRPHIYTDPSPPSSVLYKPQSSTLTDPAPSPLAKEGDMAPRDPYTRTPRAENEARRKQTYSVLTGAVAPPAAAPDLYADFHARMSNMNIENEPPSRFSFTTYATGDTRDNDESVPPSPAMSSASIISRRRPVPGSLDLSNSKATTRKPTPSQYSSALSAQSEALRRDSKALPPPPEVQSVDLITSLEAQIENLQHRRRNLQRVIRDFSRGSTIQRDKVDAFKTDLEDVKRQEHELGLRLHRAWRRKDRQERLGGGEGLWVRRVTG